MLEQRRLAQTLNLQQMQQQQQAMQRQQQQAMNGGLNGGTMDGNQQGIMINPQQGETIDPLGLYNWPRTEHLRLPPVMEEGELVCGAGGVNERKNPEVLDLLNAENVYSTARTKVCECGVMVMRFGLGFEWPDRAHRGVRARG